MQGMCLCAFPAGLIRVFVFCVIKTVRINSDCDFSYSFFLFQLMIIVFFDFKIPFHMV